MEIKTRNTNTLAPKLYDVLRREGVRTSSRNGPVLRFKEPVSICLSHPHERVNFCPVRDANPFFHLMEGLAMIGNHNSAKLLAYFAKPIAQFSDDGRTFNAFYGERARYTWGDQLSVVIDELRVKPDTRQALIQLWHPGDLTLRTKDKACNLSMLFSRDEEDRLCMTTFNRSNDAVLGGVSGANIVHLSMFQEYVAGALDRPIGPWWHISNNLHVYTEQSQWLKMETGDGGINVYDAFTDPLVPLLASSAERSRFDSNLNVLLAHMSYAAHHPEEGPRILHEGFDHPFMGGVAVPMWNAWQMHKARSEATAQHYASAIVAPDWRAACLRWLERRAK